MQQKNFGDLCYSFSAVQFISSQFDIRILLDLQYSKMVSVSSSLSKGLSLGLKVFLLSCLHPQTGKPLVETSGLSTSTAKTGYNWVESCCFANSVLELHTMQKSMRTREIEMVLELSPDNCVQVWLIWKWFKLVEEAEKCSHNLKTLLRKEMLHFHLCKSKLKFKNNDIVFCCFSLKPKVSWSQTRYTPVLITSQHSPPFLPPSLPCFQSSSSSPPAAPAGFPPPWLSGATASTLDVSWSAPAHSNAPGPLRYSLQMRTSTQRPVIRSVGFHHWHKHNHTTGTK